MKQIILVLIALISAINVLAQSIPQSFSDEAIKSSTTAPYPDVKIPHIDSIVYNFSIYVKAYEGWKSSDTTTYTLQGYNQAHKMWVSVFGSGGQANTRFKLSGSDSVKLNVPVPRFDDDVVAYRLQFMQSNGSQPVQFGFVPLKSGQVDNNGSTPGNTYTLQYQSGAVGYLTTDNQPVKAQARPANPPKLDTVTINGYKRKVFHVWDGQSSMYKRFFVRGMDYESTPVGQPSTTDGQPVTAPGETVYLADFNKSGGGQICKTLENGPYGTSVSYCFDTDLNGYMHQYLNKTSLGGHADSANALLSSRWKRDLQVMQAMGVNTIRIYHHDAMVRDMTAFLDLAYQYGIYVIMPAPAPNSSQSFSGSPKTGRLQTYEQMVAPNNTGQAWTALMHLMLVKYASHPAILAWAVGNETGADNPTSPQPAAAEIEWILAKTIKDFDSNILVTATNQDHYNTTQNFRDYYNLFLKNNTDTYLDFYSINSYRGIAPDQLQLTGMKTWLDTLDALQPPYDLPLLISEWGKNDNYSFKGIDNQFGFSRLWRMTLQRNSNLLGVAYFEFSDEPFVKNLAGQHYMGLVAYSLKSDYKPEKVQIDSLVPKFKDYNGILHKLGTDTLQYYPAVSMAGVFDSFIGDNTNPLIKDIGIVEVPNISFCAFSQSPNPWTINPRCLLLDAKINKVTPYKIQISPGGGDTIVRLELNNGKIKNNNKEKTTGEISIELKSQNGTMGTVQLGFSNLGDTPASNTNTLLYTNLGGVPMASWNNDNTALIVLLPPVTEQ